MEPASTSGLRCGERKLRERRIRAIGKGVLRRRLRAPGVGRMRSGGLEGESRLDGRERGRLGGPCTTAFHLA